MLTRYQLWGSFCDLLTVSFSIIGVDYSAVCQAYSNNAQHRLDLTMLMDDVTFIDPVGNNFVFRDRAGVSNYRINSITKGYFGETNYKQVCLADKYNNHN